MPESKGVSWRKKIHHSKSKDLPPLNVDAEDAASVEEPNDRRRSHPWRKQLHGSRPATPVNGARLTPIDSVDDTRSDRSEPSSPRRNSRPKLTRYTSLFSTFKESLEEPDFSEPWSDMSPPSSEPYPDPLQALQSIRSHVINHSARPLPSEHNSGLLRIFEDYGNLREQKEHLQNLVQDMTTDWERAEDEWSELQKGYDAEIRRLDLLIARGATGMTGLIRARQGSIIDRGKTSRKTVSDSKFPLRHEYLSLDELDRTIKLQSQRVLLHRPTSPSVKMAALSKQFSFDDADLQFPRRPFDDDTIALSRKALSDLNLVDLAARDNAKPTSGSSNSGFSGSLGDPLPDERNSFTPGTMEPSVDFDAFQALRELAILVAKRRGLEVDSFVNGFMDLFSTECEVDPLTIPGTGGAEQDLTIACDASNSNTCLIPEEFQGAERTLRLFDSPPQPNSYCSRRRHFSFEPGDDQIKALEDELMSHHAIDGDTGHIDADRPSATSSNNLTPEPWIDQVSSSPKTLFAQFQKPSKIPSPVQTAGRMRRRTSASSSTSVFAKNRNSRQNSRSSVLTTFHNNSEVALQSHSTSRGNSSHDLRGVYSPLSSSDLHGSLRTRGSSRAINRPASPSGPNSQRQ